MTDFYLPRLGGIETHVCDLSARQALVGHEVHIVTSSPSVDEDASGAPWDPDSPSTPDREGGQPEVPVHRLTDRFRSPHALHPLAVREGIRRLESLAPDVVHAHLGVASPLAFFLARAAAQRGIPTVVTVHSMWAGVRPVMKFMDLVGGWSDLPITWTAVSQAAADPVAAVLPPGTPIRILANGIDQAQWTLPAPAEPDGEVVIGAVMRLARRKRPLALLKMLARAQAELDQDGDGVRLRLVIAGDGPMRAKVEHWVERHGLSGQVDLLGRVTREEVHGVLARSHAFIAPADLESFGIAALEARCAGVPVVAKSHGGVGEFVAHEREGLLCDTDADMVHALVRLARDPALRRRMAAHNRTAPCAVAWGPLLEQTEATYDIAAAAVGRTLPVLAGAGRSSRPWPAPVV